MNRVFGWMMIWVCMQPLYGQVPEIDEGMMGIDPENRMQVEALEADQVRLDRYRMHPLDLNRATAEELSELGLLTTMQIESWIRYRTRLGKADHWYVLQGVPGWDWKTLERIKPYVHIALLSDWKRLMRLNGSATHTLLFRWSNSSATTIPNQSIGDPSHQLIRYQFRSESGWEAGWMMEKDPGETWRHPDFFSGYVQLRVPGRAGRWTLGDYTVQMGQGLIAWQGMSVASGAEVISLKKQGTTIRPYQSVGESRFMRGIGFSGSTNRWRWDAFTSRQKQTAVLYPSRFEEMSFRSVDASGYHRTQTERSRKDDLTEFSAGGRLGFGSPETRLNLNFIARTWDHTRVRLNHPVYGDSICNRFLLNTSLDYSITRGNWHGFGEYAQDGSGNRAGVIGSMWVLHRDLDLGIHIRWIGRNYQTVDGEVMQRRSGVGAEQGFRMQARVQVAARLSIELFSDLYRIPTSHVQSSTPSAGTQVGWRMLYQPNKHRSVYLRLVAEGEELELIEDSPISHLVNVREYSIRLHAQWDLDTQFQLSVRTERIQRKAGKLPSETGFMQYAELRFDPIGSRLQADMRLMWVQTDGWSTRIYAYERNVLYQVGFPAFSGSLIRGYLNMAWKWGRGRTIWFRWAVQKSIDSQRFNVDSQPIDHSFTLQIRLGIGSSGR